MNRTLISTHKLLTDYSTKSKIRTIIVGWLIYMAIFAVTRLSAVQTPLISCAERVDVTWVASSIGFIVNGLWVVAIPLVIGTVITLMPKQTFQILNLYANGAGFVGKDGEVTSINTPGESFVEYTALNFTYRKGRDGFWAESKGNGVKFKIYGCYGWREFTEPEVLRANLTQYAGLH